MQTIKTYFGPEQALTALSLLHAHGIEARILDSATLSILPLDSVALGGYRLAVPDGLETRALTLLAEQDAPSTMPAIPPGKRQYFGNQHDDEQLRKTRAHQRHRRRILLVIGIVVTAALVVAQYFPDRL